MSYILFITLTLATVQQVRGNNIVDENVLKADDNLSKLPENYYPEKQWIDLQYDEVSLSFSGHTDILVSCREKENFEVIVLNVASEHLNVSSVAVNVADKNGQELREIRSSFTKDPEFELLKITIGEYSPYLKLTIYFTSYISGIGVQTLTDQKGTIYAIGTQFQKAFARTWIPCFDNPKFRTVFHFTITVADMFDLVLFNSVLLRKSNQIKYNKRVSVYTFKHTIPIPAELLSVFVAVNKDWVKVVNSFYMEKPLKVYINQDSIKLYRDQNGDFEALIENVIRYSLRYCERGFGVKYSASEKVDIVSDSFHTALETPGLITVMGSRSLESVLSFIVHEIVHQWTGVLYVNEWWSDWWITEGFTSAITTNILRDMIKFGWISRENGGKLFMQGYETKYALGLHDFNAHVTSKGLSFADNTPYSQGMKAFAQLNDAMEGVLMACLGYVMRKYPMSSLSSSFLMDQLTLCPYSSLNVTQFLSFWIFDDEVPVVKLDFGTETSWQTAPWHNSYNYADITYSFLCPFKNILAGNCSEIQWHKYSPHFSITFRDRYNTILQDTILVTTNNSRVPIHFDPQMNEIVLVNVYNKGGFIVQYPEFIYHNFLNWIHYLASINFELYQFYGFFVSDMVHLSSRNIIDIEWLFVIHEMRDDMNSVLFAQRNLPTEFGKCLAWRFKHYLSKNPDSISESELFVLGAYLNKTFKEVGDTKPYMSSFEENCDGWFNHFQTTLTQIARKRALYY